jgi:hypothetical protein
MIRCIIFIFMSVTLISCQTTSSKACSPISKEDLSIKIYGKSLSELSGFNPTFKQGRENGQIDPFSYGTYQYGQSTSYFPRNPNLTIEQFISAVNKIKHTSNGLEFCD